MMPDFPLAQFGGRATGATTLGFGVLLPRVTPGNGQSVRVLAIHERDQYLQRVPALEVALQHSVDPRYGDCWTGEVDVAAPTDLPAGSHWGEPGRYVYRMAVDDPARGRIDWVIDSYAREFGVGRQSAVSLGAQPYVWGATEDAWRVPALSDLVMYEVNIAEFRGDLARAVTQLDFCRRCHEDIHAGRSTVSARK